MNSQFLQLANVKAVTISIDQSALALKQSAIESASLVTQVKGATDQLLCVNAMAEIKRLLKLVEQSRKSVKEPVLALGKEIDSKATAFTIELEAEHVRLQRLLTVFQVEQGRIAAEAERARQEELRRVEMERQKAEREAAAKAAAEMAKARNESERIAAEAMAVENAKRIAAENEARAKAAASVPAVAPLRTEGMRVQKRWTFEVLDLNQLVKARPELCRIEANRAAINAEIGAGKRDIPGLRVFEELQAGVTC